MFSHLIILLNTIQQTVFGNYLNFRFQVLNFQIGILGITAATCQFKKMKIKLKNNFQESIQEKKIK